MKKIIRSILKRLSPTAVDRAKWRWRKDRGDTLLRYDYPLTASSVVLDLGGFQGDWAGEIHKRYGCSIFVFEPIAEYAHKISQRFAGIPTIHVNQFGLAGYRRTEQFSIQGAASSTFKSQGQPVTAELYDVLEWFEHNAIHQCDLMKINIEGGEYELLERIIDTGLIHLINDIQIQFHDFVPNAAALMEAIQNKLAATHAPTYQYAFIWENWRHQGWCPATLDFH
jgi:FkbM family methyltransferase